MTAAELLAHPLADRVFDEGNRRLLEALASGELGPSQATEIRLRQMAQQLEAWPRPFLTDAELLGLPPNEWDVHGVLLTGGLSFLVGPKGVGKSLLALDLACSLALGRTWLGHAVRRSDVVYVAAEGARSLHSRLALWKGYHGCEDQESNVRWMPRRLQLLDRASLTDFLIDAALPNPPGLVILDTFPRCTQGIAENDPEGMGRALEAADEIRERLGAGVLLVTHPSRDGGDMPRGHSSQEGAADAIWVLKDNDGERVLSCAKLKDGDETLTHSLTLISRLGSVMLVPSDLVKSHASLTPNQRTILATIRDVDHGLGIAASVIIDVCRLPKPSVYRALKHLHESGYLAHKSQRYSLTPTGAAQLVSPVSSESPGSLTGPLGGLGERVSHTWGGLLRPPCETRPTAPAGSAMVQGDAFEPEGAE